MAFFYHFINLLYYISVLLAYEKVYIVFYFVGIVARWLYGFYDIGRPEWSAFDRYYYDNKYLLQ